MKNYLKVFFLLPTFLFPGLQSLWTTAICSSNLQHRQPHINPPTTSPSCDQLLQTESPISDKGGWKIHLLNDVSFSSSQPRFALLNILIKNPIKLKIRLGREEVEKQRKKNPSNKKFLFQPLSILVLGTHTKTHIHHQSPSVFLRPNSTWKVKKGKIKTQLFFLLSVFFLGYPSSYSL